MVVPCWGGNSYDPNVAFDVSSSQKQTIPSNNYSNLFRSSSILSCREQSNIFIARCRTEARAYCSKFCCSNPCNWFLSLVTCGVYFSCWVNKQTAGQSEELLQIWSVGLKKKGVVVSYLPPLYTHYQNRSTLVRTGSLVFCQNVGGAGGPASLNKVSP